ncbi:unnamed protein product, partial [marine sediment metagenome]
MTVRIGRVTSVVVLTGLLVVGCVTFEAVAEPEYTILDLGTLGGTESHAYGINNAGQVVGE